MFPARNFLLILLNVQFSMCPTPPRMVRHYRFNTTQEAALEISRDALENLGYEINVYTNESHFIQTVIAPIKKDIRRYDYSLAIIIEDHINVYIIAQKHIFKRGSESSIGGGKSITEVDAVDWMPYSLQQKIFVPLTAEFSNYGLHEIKELSLNKVPISRMITNV